VSPPGPGAAGWRRPPGRRLNWLAPAVGVLAFGYLFRGLLLPLLVAAGLAYLLNPLIAWAEGFSIRRGVAVTGLYLGLVVVLVGGALALGPRVGTEAAGLAERLPKLADEVDAALVLAGRDLGQAFPATRRFLPSPEARRGWIDQLLEGRGGQLSDVVEQAGHLLLFAILVPFFAFFLLRDTRRFLALLLDRVPPAHIETTVAVWCEINRITGSYIRGVALDGLVIGTLASVGLWGLGVPYPLLLGGFAGLANIVPIVGPLLSAIAAGLVALTHGRGLDAIGGIALFFVVLKVLDDTLVQPLTIGRSVHLHPVLLLASVVAGGQALGILGMVVAVPAATVLQETVRLWLEHRQALDAGGPGAWAPPDASHFVC
jgi:predicted PurR-regulated permease PerM